MTHSDKAPTAEQLARADCIAMGKLIVGNICQDGWTVEMLRAAHVSALAAIIETTARAAAVVKEYAAEAQDSYHRCLGMNAAEALECGDHLEKAHD